MDLAGPEQSDNSLLLPKYLAANQAQISPRRLSGQMVPRTVPVHATKEVLIPN